MRRRPPRSMRTCTLLPFTTPFRSAVAGLLADDERDLVALVGRRRRDVGGRVRRVVRPQSPAGGGLVVVDDGGRAVALGVLDLAGAGPRLDLRSEEHTSELQSLMRISYAVFCLQKKQEIQQSH